ncbi:hypothetical protein Tco_0668189 [Tanacetum coccineum]
MLAIQAEEGEGLGHPFEPQPPPSTAQPTHEEPIPNVVSSPHQITQTPRKALNKVTKLPQTNELIPNVLDEAVYEEWDDRVERATTTAVSLDAEQASGNINRTQSTTIPNVPLSQGIGAGGSPRVHILGSDEGSMTLQELTVLCTTLSKKVESLEADLKQTKQDLKQTKQAYGAAYTKLIMKVKILEKTIKTSHSRRRAKIVVSDDEEDSSKQLRMIEEIDQDAGVTLVTPTQGEDQPEDQLGVLSAAKVLANAAKTNVHTYTRKRRAVITSSGGISTAKESVSTAGMVQEVNISIPSPVVAKDKGKGKMKESEDEQTKRTKLQQEQERLGHEAAVRLARVEANEELSKRLQAEERNKYSQVDQAKMLELFETTMKNVNTFVPMETEDRERASELAAGSSQATIIDSTEKAETLIMKVLKRQNNNESSRDQFHNNHGSRGKKEFLQRGFTTNDNGQFLWRSYVLKPLHGSNIQSLTGRFTLKNLENIKRLSGLVCRALALDYWFESPQAQFWKAQIEALVYRENLKRKTLTKSADSLYSYQCRVTDPMERLARMFALNFWRSLQKALGTNLDMSTAYHPQTDEQEKCGTIKNGEDILPSACVDRLWKGVRLTHFPFVEFSYNNKLSQLRISAAQFDSSLRSKVSREDLKIRSSDLAREFNVGSLIDKRRCDTAFVIAGKPMEFQVRDLILSNAVKTGFYILTFHVSNLKKCHVDEPLAVPLDGLHIDDKLHFIEEPIEIMDREAKRLKQSRIPIIKVRWNSRRGFEFTWEREDQFRKKYPHLFTKTAPSSSAAS